MLFFIILYMNIAQEHGHMTPETRILMSVDILCLVSIYHHKNTDLFLRNNYNSNVITYFVANENKY